MNPARYGDCPTCHTPIETCHPRQTSTPDHTADYQLHPCGHTFQNVTWTATSGYHFKNPQKPPEPA